MGIEPNRSINPFQGDYLLALSGCVFKERVISSIPDVSIKETVSWEIVPLARVVAYGDCFGSVTERKAREFEFIVFSPVNEGIGFPGRIREHWIAATLAMFAHVTHAATNLCIRTGKSRLVIHHLTIAHGTPHFP